VLIRNTFPGIIPAMKTFGGKREHGSGFPPDPPLEGAIARLATAQHGVVALAQLHELGLEADAVRKRVACGRMHRMHAAVFAVGHAPLTRNGWYMAAVLACGDGASLSHRAAAALRMLRQSSRSKVDVTSPRRTGRERRGIDAHTSTTLLLPRDIETVDGIPRARASRARCWTSPPSCRAVPSSAPSTKPMSCRCSTRERSKMCSSVPKGTTESACCAPSSTSTRPARP